MKCKDIERLVIESSAEKLDEKTKLEMERHVKECARCSRLEEDMTDIRNALPWRTGPVLPHDLNRRTYQLCRAELVSPLKEGEVSGGKTWLKSIPFSIKTAFICLIVLTVIWAIPVFRELKLDGSLSVTTILILSLIVQNAVMLIFAPLLLRRFRMKKSGFQTLTSG